MVAEAVESVLAQNYPNFEHIVTDGGSTDGTLEVLKRYPHLRVSSEPDRSLYDAVNKGIRHARGDVIGFLNTDDVYAPEVLGAVGEAFAADPELDMVYGGSATFRVGPTGEREVLGTMMTEAEMSFSPGQAAFRPFSINARFFHRRVYERVGLYDDGYRIAGDREFYLRAFLSMPIRATFLGRLVYLYRHHTGSLTFNDELYSERIALEHLRIATKVLEHPEWRHAAAPFRRLHTFETLGLVAHHVRNRRWRDAVRFGWQGWARDGRWPVEFVVALARRACGQRTSIPER
jgi:glycosyltransferase involved in cell wall biosynthesis